MQDNDLKKEIIVEQSENYINTYNLEGSEKLSGVFLINVAKSYIALNNSKKATKVLEEYIKKTNDIDIINNDLFFSIKNTEEFKKLKERYLPKLNSFILYFFAIGIIGVFISIVLNIRRKGDVVSNVLIGLFVFLHSLFIMNLCLFLSNYIFTFSELFPISISFSFLYGPLIYFYFKRSFEEYSFKKKDLLHLLPTLILVSYLLPKYFLTSEEKLHILLNNHELFHTSLVTIIVLKCISLLSYSIVTYVLYQKNKKNKNQYKEISLWRRNLVTLNLLYSIIYFFYGIFIIFKMAYIFLYPQSFLLSGIVLYIGVIAYVQPKVFSKKYIFKKEEDLKIKYEKSGLTTGFSEDLKEELLLLLNSEKIYRNNKITLDDLSDKLGTTRYNISQVINEHFEINFFHLINKYRINEAVEIMRTDYNRNLKIIDIAYDVGFNNKVTFNKAFKAETSLTPSQYIESLNKLGIA